jgi:riboflavin kinase/FMN adenylyltransferase
MRVYSWEDVLRAEKPIITEVCSLTVGVFDGVHIGHETLLKKVVADGKVHGIVTFSDSINKLLNKKEKGVLTPIEEKLTIFSNIGFNFAVLIDFSHNFGKLNCEDFFRYLHGFVNISRVFTGSDFRCGYKGRSDVTDIAKILNVYGSELEILSKIVDNSSREISSSRIRKYIKDGDMDSAAHLLGRRYSVSLRQGQFIKDKIVFHKHLQTQLMPEDGVFSVKSTTGDEFTLEVHKDKIFINKPEGSIPDRIIF